jgi:hypothetical protein
VGNGGCLSRTPGFFDIIQAFLPKMPKLLLSRVFCVYTDKSGVCRFIQSLLSKREFCLHKILNEPPFIPDPISPAIFPPLEKPPFNEGNSNW